MSSHLSYKTLTKFKASKCSIELFVSDPGLQIFTDPLTGKMYVKTKDGEIMEVVIGEDGKTYLRTKSGTLKGNILFILPTIVGSNHMTSVYQNYTQTTAVNFSNNLVYSKLDETKQPGNGPSRRHI